MARYEGKSFKHKKVEVSIMCKKKKEQTLAKYIKSVATITGTVPIKKYCNA